MSKQYICDLCKKVFNQKIDFTRHQNKKAPCISLTEMQQIIQTTEEKVDSKNLLTQTFKSCLNIMRDNEGLTGEKALRNLSYLLVLKLIEPHIGKEINFENYEYDFENGLGKINNYENRKILLDVVYFKNLYEYTQKKEDTIQVIMDFLWNIILSTHPTTKNIFLEGKNFDIQHKSTFKKLIEKLNSLDLSKTEYDVLGNSYEEVIKDIMTGKVLGQFFTQPLVKKIMVRLINPQIFPDGKIETCCDPTMGTGGFLITYLQYILQQARTKNINPDWDFIKNEGIYGKELEPDTYQLAISNMLISSGHMFEKLDRGDSIRKPITKKFDNILANPPFGIKGLKYDDFESSLKEQYVPIKSDNAVSLFIQAIIYMLKINGKCAVVLPDGQDLFSKTNTTLVSIREYLMKTCDLKEIIYLPAGIFENTSIKTCIFYFVKKMEGNEILVIKEKTKSKKDYIFSKTHQTSKVKFYDYNESKDEKFLLVEVPIEKIVSNSYSLNYAEYMKDETEEEQYEEGVVVKTIGEVCSIDYGTRIVKGNNTEGEFPVYGSGRAMFSTNTFNREGYNILIGRFALSLECVRFINEKIFLNDSGLTIKPKTDILLHKYIGYYLLYNQNIIYNCARGTAQKNLEMDIFKSIKIPIPSLERQQEIVKYLDFIYEKANKTSNEKIAELKQLNEFCLNNQKIFGENVVKTLGEICKFDIGGTPSRSKNEYYENGNNLWVSVRELNGGYIYDTKEKITDIGVKNSSVKLFAKDTVLFSFKLSIGKTAIVGNPLYTNEAIAGILSKNNNILNNKYLYYYLTINDFSKLGSGILGNGSLNKKSLEQIKIIVPSLERQKEIVDYVEFNDTLIKQLEKEIENNKRLAQKFITGIVKSQVNNIEEYIENINQTNVEIDSFEEDNIESDVINEDIIHYDLIDEPKPIIKKVLIKVKKNNII
jgi:type I restriction-modification system DNA methylase subunit/restriction endonuclease S subunit